MNEDGFPRDGPADVDPEPAGALAIAGLLNHSVTRGVPPGLVSQPLTGDHASHRTLVADLDLFLADR